MNFHLTPRAAAEKFQIFHQFTTYAEFGDWTEIPKNLKFSKKSEILGFEKISRKLFQFFLFYIKMEKSYQNMNAENRTAKYLKYLCGHGKYKYQCKECKGSQICPHSRRKSECKESGGSQICPHNTRKSQCKDVGVFVNCSRLLNNAMLFSNFLITDIKLNYKNSNKTNSSR